MAKERLTQSQIDGVEYREWSPMRSKLSAYLTNGGRVLGVTETGGSLKEAIEKAYETVKTVNFANAYYRKDIGKRALEAVK